MRERDSQSPIQATSRRSISHVSGLGSCFKMGRLYADGPITAMQNKHSIRDGAIEDLIGNAVGITFSERPHSYRPVSTLTYAGRPIPAAFLWGSTGHEPDEGFLFGESCRTLIPTSGGVTGLPPFLVMPSAPTPGATGAVTLRNLTLRHKGNPNNEG